jgi:hypothetical protein
MTIPDKVTAADLRNVFHGSCVEADEWRPLADYIQARVEAAHAAGYREACEDANGRAEELVKIASEAAHAAGRAEALADAMTACGAQRGAYASNDWDAAVGACVRVIQALPDRRGA